MPTVKAHAPLDGAAMLAKPRDQLPSGFGGCRRGAQCREPSHDQNDMGDGGREEPVRSRARVVYSSSGLQIRLCHLRALPGGSIAATPT